MPTRALVIRTAGTNCDGELIRAFTLAGAATQSVHLDKLVAEPRQLDEFDLIGFPGGFSYGDDIASGRVFAVRLRERLYPALRAAAERGALMIGVCNGFQVLTQVGLLPGPMDGAGWPDEPPPQTCALADNEHARFIDRWVRIEPVGGTVCAWTRHLSETDWPEEAMTLPIAHGEGRFVATSDAILDLLTTRGQIALRYADGHNVNGSQRRIAGICDASGRIFGLMPHPERYLDWSRHPFWTRLGSDVRRGETPGLSIFRAAVDEARAARNAPSAAVSR